MVRLASGLLKSISHEPEHCCILLQAYFFLSQSIRKSKHACKQLTLSNGFYHCILSAQELDKINLALEKQPEHSIVQHKSDLNCK